MIDIEKFKDIPAVFFEAVKLYAHNALLAVPANPTRAYAPHGAEISYAEAGAIVRRLTEVYRSAGYGVGHRIGLLIENRPEHLLHKLAMNALGACCVPLNADYRPAELAFVIDHAKVDLVVVIEQTEGLIQRALEETQVKPEIVRLDDAETSLPSPNARACSTTPSGETAASILYTSGTTGKPKGCVLSQRYELASGAWYATRGGLASFGEGRDRIYNPLPLFHINASILSFFCVMLKGNCQIQTDRFQPSKWWGEVKASGATVVHYLGVVVPMLLNQDPKADDADHAVRFGIGAGVEPQLHAVFEKRFGFPLIEIWGMTEMVRGIFNNKPPRHVGTRAFGREQPGLEVRIVDDVDVDVPAGTAGEMVIRHCAATPRQDFFSGYLDDEAATESAWRGGWFHTGDIVLRSTDGALHFVERRKNIIRRSGENIAAAEVEALLQTHALVEQVAVLAVHDEVREEEVLACLVLKPTGLLDPDATVRNIFDFCNEHLSYYKAPGWVWIADRIPTTATQKIQKHQIFPKGVDPRSLPGMRDLRSWKKRRRGAATDQGGGTPTNENNAPPAE
jgi:crotonobetaine/carnitine-CoA ligase